MKTTIQGIAALFIFVAAAASSLSTAAAGDDNFDGAVWKFTMTSQQNQTRVLVGQFRVSNHVLYQKVTPDDPAFSKKVGTNRPMGTRTRFDVQDFRAFTKVKRKQIQIAKGTGRLTLNKFGDWEGLFTDGKGDNWRFRTLRIRE